MRKMLLFVAAVALAAPAAVQAETWRGTITDSMCGAKHSAEKHGEKAADHKTCVERCVANGGEYVLVAKDKVFKISNQKFEDLKKHAGHEVMLSGDIKDETITVTRIELPKAETKK